ncbi:MAG: hypothetical protein KAI17_09230, partial [Thiotrichaceae bacterium]|nr:hypothetical protein [Thiotrichaceae bacterium]
LTGTQGVIIPASNIKYLMLRWDVVLAAKANQFNIYTVETVDEALQYLTGMEWVIRDQDGKFPADSFNAKVEEQLLSFNTIRQQFMTSDK